VSRAGIGVVRQFGLNLQVVVKIDSGSECSRWCM